MPSSPQFLRGFSLLSSRYAAKRQLTAAQWLREWYGIARHHSRSPLFCRFDRREIGVPVDRFFAKMFAAVDHKYGEGDGEQRAEKGAKISVRFPVVRHGNLLNPDLPGKRAQQDIVGNARFISAAQSGRRRGCRAEV